MPRRVALATYARAPELAPDDRALVPALAECGVHADAAVWNGERVAWDAYDAVIIRSCWDYHLQIDRFDAWLGELEARGVCVMNSPRLLRWNANKRYLLDLAQHGVATIPTLIVPAGAAATAEVMAAAEGWESFVVKPAVSASGYETYALRLPLDDAARRLVGRVAITGDVLLQPFVPEVARDGEYSLVFIDGEFSHAALKRAAAGEFRVQTDYGGSVEPVVVGAELIEQAERVVGALAERPVYARVDGVVRGDAFLLMELELIEPNLFLGGAVGSVERLARAIDRRIGGARRGGP